MAAPRRFTSGITDLSSADPMGQMNVLDPTKRVLYHEDFVGPFLEDASITNETATAGGISIVASASMTVTNEVDADSPNGNLVATTGAADNENMHFYTVSPCWRLESGKKFFFEARFEVTATNVDENEIFIGLATNQTTTNFFAADGTARTFDDGIGFYSTDGDTDIDVIVGEADVFDNVTIKTAYVTATWYTMSIYYDGTGITCYVDGTAVAKLTPSAIPVSAIGPAMWFKSGEAAAHILKVDYITAIKER